MANAKRKWVAFKGNQTVPAEMVGKKEDQKVQAGEGVQVMAFYADSVVQDGIAEYSDASAKGALKKQDGVDAVAKVKIALLEGELKEAKGGLARAEADVESLSAKLKASTEEVDVLKKKLSEIQSERPVAQAAVTDALDAAEGTDALQD